MHERSHIAVKRGIQTLLQAVYPPECLGCRAYLADASGLCGACWRDTPFIDGNVCEMCGTPLMGQVSKGDRCDDCMSTARPWVRGRAALLYKDRARQLVLALKHGDRHDIVRPAASWMVRAIGPVPENAVIVPVPLHWGRMVRRRFNQAALLAHALGCELGLPVVADGLVRARATAVLDGKGRDARFAELRAAIEPHPRKCARLAGRPVVLVDDVMTTGATLAACSDACLSAQAREVHVITLARVAKDA